MKKLKLTSSNSRTDGLTRKGDILCNLFFIIFSICCLLPIILVISVSLSDEGSLLKDGYKFIPKHFTILAYRYLFIDWSTILRAYGVTILVTVVGTVLSVLLMALYAYPLSRTDFPFKKLFTILIFIPMLFSGGLVPFYLVYVRILHINDSLIALIIPGLISGFNIIIMRTFFKQNIPLSVLEAARIDGATEFKMFRKIVLPLSLPVLATMALFSTLNYWNDWFNSLLFINNEKLYSLQYVMLKAMLTIQYLQDHITASGSSQLNTDISKVPSEGVRMAMVVVGMGPIIIAYPFFQKYFVKGLTVGAVKG